MGKKNRPINLVDKSNLPLASLTQNKFHSRVKDLFTLRAEARFSLCELACEKQPLPTTVQFSIVHARNSSRDSQAKLIVRSVVKWREFRGNKKIALTLICYARFTQDSRNALNRSRTGKNQFFKIYSSRFLDGFERLSAEATFRTTAHTAKMKPLLTRQDLLCLKHFFQVLLIFTLVVPRYWTKQAVFQWNTYKFIWNLTISIIILID